MGDRNQNEKDDDYEFFDPSRQFQPEKKNAVSIYVDNSFSMQSESEIGSLLDMAKNRAKEIVSVYGNADVFQVLTNDYEGKHQRLVTKEESGDLIIPLKKGLISKSHIHGEIGQVASGQIPGRESDQEITFFKSVGVAVQDVAVAEMVFRQAKSLRQGTDFDL